MATTKSRAQRSADQAKADQDQEQQQPEEQQQEQPQPEAQPKPEDKPTATFDLGHGRILFYRPSLRLADGTVTDCPHVQWGHEKEQHAMKCLRKLAADRGVTLAK